MLRWATVHRLTGVATALAVVLVNSIVVTYFIGTSRWCKEVCETYRSGRVAHSAQHGAQAADVSLGRDGHADRRGRDRAGRSGRSRPPDCRTRENWVTPHLLGALAGLLFIAWVFFVEWKNIDANHVVIADVLDRSPADPPGARAWKS